MGVLECLPGSEGEEEGGVEVKDIYAK